MGDIHLSYTQFFLLAALIGALVGGLFGLIPLILGRRRGRPQLGWYGLIASIIAGIVHIFLAIVVAAVLSVVILTRKPAENKEMPGEPRDQ